MATRAAEKFLSVNNLQIRYLDWGTEGKPPLVCLHGHAGQAHIWDEFAEAASAAYHVYAIDQRGHGLSQWAGDGYDRDRFVEDLAAVMNALAIPRATLVGLSMGGWNCLLYTADHPEKVERVILVDIGPEPGEAFKQMTANRPPTPLEFASFEDAIAWARAGNPWASNERLRRDMSDRLRQADDGRWIWKADPALFNNPPTDMTDPARIARCWRSLEAITCPILVVRGKGSPLLSDDVLARMRRANPRLSTVDVEDAGHVVPVDKPQAFILATGSFLGVAG